MKTVWAKHSGWRVKSVNGVGVGGSIPLVELGAAYEGIHFVLQNMRGEEDVAYTGSGLGLSLGLGLSPVAMSASGPINKTQNTYISTWPDSNLDEFSFDGTLWILSATAEAASVTSAGQLWYFRGHWNLTPLLFNSVAAAVVGGDGGSTELAAGNFSVTRYSVSRVAKK